MQSAMFKRLGLGMSLAALCCQPVAAQDSLSEKLSARQTWTMSAPRGQPQPDCVETWIFTPDSQLIVESGAETVTKKWRVGDDGGQVSLYLHQLFTTGGPDCLGTINDPSEEPEPEEGGPLWILEFNSGDDLILCSPKFVLIEKDNEKMPMMDDDNCWGELKPVK